MPCPAGKMGTCYFPAAARLAGVVRLNLQEPHGGVAQTRRFVRFSMASPELPSAHLLDSLSECRLLFIRVILIHDTHCDKFFKSRVK